MLCFRFFFRLCLRNLPLKVDENALRTALMKSIGHAHTTRIKKILIMRNKERFDSSGKGRSLGFGFVEFTSHKDALCVLRATNNNPNVFGAERRPIVEFAIENSLALKAKEQRVTKQRKRERALRNNQENVRQEQGKTNKEKRLEKMKVRREARKRKREAKRKRKHEAAVTNSKSALEHKQSNLKKKRTEVNLNSLEMDETFASSRSKSVSKKLHNSTKKQSRKRESTKRLLDASESNTNKSDEFIDRRALKRKAKEMKDESKFNEMVNKYKAKLFGKDTRTSSAKRARWYE